MTDGSQSRVDLYRPPREYETADLNFRQWMAVSWGEILELQWEASDTKQIHSNWMDTKQANKEGNIQKMVWVKGIKCSYIL